MVSAVAIQLMSHINDLNELFFKEILYEDILWRFIPASSPDIEDLWKAVDKSIILVRVDFFFSFTSLLVILLQIAVFRNSWTIYCLSSYWKISYYNGRPTIHKFFISEYIDVSNDPNNRTSCHIRLEYKIHG